MVGYENNKNIKQKQSVNVPDHERMAV